MLKHLIKPILPTTLERIPHKRRAPAEEYTLYAFGPVGRGLNAEGRLVDFGFDFTAAFYEAQGRYCCVSWGCRLRSVSFFFLKLELEVGRSGTEGAERKTGTYR